MSFSWKKRALLVPPRRYAARTVGKESAGMAIVCGPINECVLVVLESCRPCCGVASLT